ncbi:MAG: permease [Candidatus Hadarchaeaceae archaeon]
MRYLKVLGDDKSHMAVLFIAIFIYAATLAINPGIVKSCIDASLKEVQKLMIPIFTAIFLGGLMKNLMTPKSVSKLFGTSGARNIFTAGLFGSILPPCPFAAYPLVSAFKERGMALSTFMTMLITSTMVEIPQIFAGIAILGLKIELTRILFAFLGSMIVGYLFFLYMLKRGQDDASAPVLS